MVYIAILPTGEKEEIELEAENYDDAVEEVLNEFDEEQVGALCHTVDELEEVLDILGVEITEK